MYNVLDICIFICCKDLECKELQKKIHPISIVLLLLHMLHK